MILAVTLLALVPLRRAEGSRNIAAGGQKSRKEAFESQFLLFGTVFTGEGFALPGAEIKVRLEGKHKAKWEARSDRRGEFAVRVPKGADYELEIAAKGYTTATRKVDARQGNRADMVFRLEPAAMGKKK